VWARLANKETRLGNKGIRLVKQGGDFSYWDLVLLSTKQLQQVAYSCTNFVRQRCGRYTIDPLINHNR